MAMPDSNIDIDNYYFIFDVETTGLPMKCNHTKNTYYSPEILQAYDTSRIVSIAWMIFDKNGKIQSSRYAVVTPDGFVSADKALQVHGITDQYAQENGIPITTVFKEIKQVLENCDSIATVYSIGYLDLK